MIKIMKRRKFIQNTLLSAVPLHNFLPFDNSLSLSLVLNTQNRGSGIINDLQDINPFYTPGGITGDAFPFFFKGEWHLFHMQMPNIAHRVTRDFITYKDYPPVVTRGKSGEPDSNNLATGCVIEKNGNFYCFYTGNQNICLTTSTDMKQWKKYDNNPLLEGDEIHYEKENFRDPFVFFNEQEGLWWMLFGTKVPREPRQRAGCVGLAKSTNLTEWSFAEPLWNPGIGPHADCPQLIYYENKWYLLYLQRTTRYQHANTPKGPFSRASTCELGTMMANAGSRVASDGKRWISFPFITRLKDDNEYGNWEYGGELCVPRELSFYSDGSITEAPVREMVLALHKRKFAFDVSHAKSLVGEWQLSNDEAQSKSPSGGTLLFSDTPNNIYIEADISFSISNMEAHILLRLDSKLDTGYQLSLHPDTQMLYLRPLSHWDIELELASRPIDIIPNRPVKVRIFLSNTILDIFVDDKYSMTARVYRYKEGNVSIEFRDGVGIISKLLMCKLGPN